LEVASLQFKKLILCVTGCALFGLAARAQTHSDDCQHLITRPNAHFVCLHQRSTQDKIREAREQQINVFYNTLTEEFFVGDRAFHHDDHEAALATLGQRNTRTPSGFGWNRVSEKTYIAYMRSVKGFDTPMDQAIYNNCVVVRSRGASESVLREVRDSCRETAENPSRLDRWRWGD
jgi:hypothetical protein